MSGMIAKIKTIGSVKLIFLFPDVIVFAGMPTSKSASQFGLVGGLWAQSQENKFVKQFSDLPATASPEDVLQRAKGKAIAVPVPELGQVRLTKKGVLVTTGRDGKEQKYTITKKDRDTARDAFAVAFKGAFVDETVPKV